LISASIAAARHSAPIPVGRWVESTLVTRADTAWFHLRLDSPGSILLTLGGEPAPFRLALFGASGRQLAVSDRGANQFEDILRWLRPGEYFAAVSVHDLPEPGHRYRVLVRRVPAEVAVLDAHPVVVGGLFTITGQLVNNSGRWQATPSVTARIRGRTYTALAEAPVLAPGARAGFRVAAPAPVAPYQLTVSAAAARPAPHATVAADEPYEISGGRVRYAGQVSGPASGTVHVRILRHNRIGALVDIGHAIVTVVPGLGPAHYEIDLPAYPYISAETITAG
jgi:hypothetical protein